MPNINKWSNLQMKANYGKYPWIDDYCLAMKGVTKDIQPAWNDATRYWLRDKMFAMVGVDNEGEAIITLKLDPSHGLFMREQHKDIIAGYHMNKTHWNSLYLEGDVPDDIVKAMLTGAYEVILKSLPKKIQKEI